MSNRIDEVTIVGGGTAGWLTATFLATALNSLNREHPVKITLIESPSIPTVGVGESTLASMPQMLEVLGIDEKAFIKRCNVTFKCAGRFVNWNVDSEGRPRTFITPFNGADPIKGYHPAYYFNRFGSVSGRPDYADNMMPNQGVIDHFRGPRTKSMGDYEGVIGYSYHLDAKLFAEQLREIAQARGVHHILDDVIDVGQASNGFINRLTLKEAGDMPVKFVVDCSGFRGLIMREVLQEPFVSYDDVFLADSAIPVMVPHTDTSKIRPCTTATGLSAGWMWNVPLYNRVGTGYVYSSKFIDDDQAMTELMAQLGDVEPLNDPKPIRFRVGVSRRAWVKNCVAIGLSGSFVEPLEATAIGMIEKAARWLCAYFPDAGVSEVLAKRYNQLMDETQNEARDFIFMHYYLSNREDTPFWKAVVHDLPVPQSLQEKLDLWRVALPAQDMTLNHQMFDWENYLYALYGKGFFDNMQSTLGDSLQKSDWVEYSKMLDQARHNMVTHLPNHYDLLTHIRKQAGK